MTTNPYRLPRTVVPSAYRIFLTPNLKDFTFTGRVEIDIEVTEPVKSFALNANELQVGAATVTSNGTSWYSADPLLDAEYETATFSFDEPLTVGPAQLELAFTGTLNDQLHGFYRSTYTDDQGVQHTLATTQFESHDARKAFPCWDEPAFKATYQVTLTVPSELAAFSNTAELSNVDLGNGQKVVTFAPTMKMSTYLVAFVVGPFDASETTMVRGVPMRVLFPKGKGHLIATAMETAQHALEFFVDYFDIPYPGDKLDLIAIPDFAAGAMENLGLVTFRETDLLLDPASASFAEIERVATVINHEIAHMWFGDLVTMEWWEGIWLNEAFATFMEGLCTEHFRPQWQQWVSFNPSRDMAFGVDGLHSTRAIEYEVIAPNDCRGMFDVLTYIKGCAVLRMLEQYLGRETFRDGIRHYLRRHAYGNTVTQDLWSALESVSGQPVGAIMDTWILQGGHPLVHVENGTISQTPFSYLPPQTKSAIGSTWLVPVLSRTLGSDTITKQLLDGPSAPLTNTGVVVVNAGGSGFYRTSYGQAELEALAPRIGELDVLERAVLFSDTWAAIMAGSASLSSLFTLARGLIDLNEPSTWQVVAQAVAMIDRVATDEERVALAALTKSLFGPVLERLTWNVVTGESEQIGELRALAIEMLALYGMDAAVEAEALRRFDAGDVRGDLARPIVSITGNANRPGTVDVFDERRRAADSPQEEQRYLFGLASIPDVAVADAVLRRATDGIRNQDAPFLIGAMMANRKIGEHVWRSVTQRWDHFTSSFPKDLHAMMLRGLPALIGDAEVAREIRAFHEGHPLESRQMTLTQDLDRMDRGVLFAQRVRPTLLDTLRSAIK